MQDSNLDKRRNSSTDTTCFSNQVKKTCQLSLSLSNSMKLLFWYCFSWLCYIRPTVTQNFFWEFFSFKTNSPRPNWDLPLSLRSYLDLNLDRLVSWVLLTGHWTTAAPHGVAHGPVTVAWRVISLANPTFSRSDSCPSPPFQSLFESCSRLMSGKLISGTNTHRCVS